MTFTLVSMRRTVLKLALVGVALLAADHLFGIDLRSLGSIATEDLSHASEDAGALLSGEYSQRTAERLAAQAGRRLEAEAARLPDGGDDDMHRELMAERKRLLREKAERAERVASDFLAGDLDSLKRQVADNARQASGDN